MSPESSIDNLLTLEALRKFFISMIYYQKILRFVILTSSLKNFFILHRVSSVNNYKDRILWGTAGYPEKFL